MASKPAYQIQLETLRDQVSGITTLGEAQGMSTQILSILSDLSWLSNFGPIATILQDANATITDVVEFKQKLTQAINSILSIINTVNTIGDTANKIGKAIKRVTTGKNPDGDGRYQDFLDPEPLAVPVVSSVNRNYINLRGLFVPKTEGLGDAFGFDESRMFLFQFNPEEVKSIKDTNYTVRSYTGLDYNDYIWASGGEKTISFNLFLDASPSTFSRQFRNTELEGLAGLNTNASARPRGVLPQIELLESFLRPEVKDTNGNVKVPAFSSGGIVTKNQFAPPPILIFVYGSLYLEGILREAATTYTLWDEKLIPRRAEVSIVFSVLEQVEVKQQLPLYNIRN